MSATGPENTTHDGVVASVRRFLDELPEKEELIGCIAEGRAVAEIVAPLSLPEEILAAVHVYPAFRDDLVSLKTLDNNKLSNISRYILGMQQLDRHGHRHDLIVR